MGGPTEQGRWLSAQAPEPHGLGSNLYSVTSVTQLCGVKAGHASPSLSLSICRLGLTISHRLCED